MISEILEKNNNSRSRCVDIGLENVAVAATRVVERLPRCSNKGVQKRRCLQNVYENHLFRERGAAPAWRRLTNLEMRQNPYSQRPVWGITGNPSNPREIRSNPKKIMGNPRNALE